ncbi:MAG: 50S ribosomal protein L27 [Elusimicrobia bacterium HGW-Elusimicrobia-1]|nr:MAG: 50S ribosomal protein L27 [Elusimicrobia bacterium HGW-Elusimicrobia-1]
MAHTKSQGSSTNGRNSPGQRLGVKVYGSQSVLPGAVIIRQRGTKVYPGAGVGMGSDFTIFAKAAGVVSFKRGAKDRLRVSVLPSEK